MMTFFIAADDMCQLWLSTDFDPAGKVRIAWHNNWTERYDWDKNETQESDPITLEAGEIYYIEAIFKEHEGGDNCAVAWQGPGIPQRVVIPGSYLSPVHDGECTTIAYYIDGLSEQVQLGSRLKVEFAGEPIDAGDLPCEPGGANHYVFTHETEVDQLIAGMGLFHFGARGYDAAIGMWISTDPLKEYYSPYSYCANNPVIIVDPNGEGGVVAGALIGGGVGVAAGGLGGYLGGLWRTRSLEGAKKSALAGMIGGGISGAGAGAAVGLAADVATAGAGALSDILIIGALVGGSGAVGGTVQKIATNYLEGNPDLLTGAGNAAGKGALGNLLVGFGGGVLLSEASKVTAVAVGVGLETLAVGAQDKGSQSREFREFGNEVKSGERRIR